MEEAHPAAPDQPAIKPAGEVAGSSEGPSEPLGSAIENESLAAPEAQLPTRSPRRALHTPRRGAARQSPAHTTPNSRPSAVKVQRAEALLRLDVDSIRQHVSLSLVLARPRDFPEQIVISDAAEGNLDVGAFDDRRYDDVDLSWRTETLSDELRVRSANGMFEWIRSARTIHVFAPRPGELGKMSASAATLGADNSIICREEDAPEVISVCEAAGSPRPDSLENWDGIPSGWIVLTGYRPARSPGVATDRRLSGLDPGFETEIELCGGLKVFATSFAEGAAPAIMISRVVAGGRITIDGQPAVQGADGTWTAPSWDGPGTHLVDVVPGPSLTYEIIPDPAANGGWDRVNAHPDRFKEGARGPWVAACICGAQIFAEDERRVIATDAALSGVVIGSRAGAAALRPRKGVRCAIGLVPFTPAFLINSTGFKRTEGVVVWLGERAVGRTRDPGWANVVRQAAGRHLAVHPDSPAAHAEWDGAMAAARSLRRKRR